MRRPDASRWLISRSTVKDRTEAQRQIEANSNEWLQTSEKLDDQRRANITLSNDLSARVQDLSVLTNQINDTSNTLSKTQDSLKAAEDEVTKRDAQIADLESQNKALDARATDLSNSITNLQSQIDDTQKKLATSEGDKAFLQKELQRLMTEKAELERQFNDIKVMRAQVAKLKEELDISRRLAWIREGIFARADQKGAEQLMQKSAPSTNAVASAPAHKANNYDLNVEVNADGTVRVIPPTTNSNSAPVDQPPK